MRPWAAPTVSDPVVGHVTVPGSKSATARAYVLAALADGPSTLTGVLDARDTRLMRAALASLGVGFDDLGPDTVRVRPPEAFSAGPVEVGLSGTVMRFVPPLAAMAHGASHFTGDAEASARPVAPLLAGLRQAGVRVEGDTLPFTVTGTGSVQGGAVTVDASGSSQFVSGLLMAGARFTDGLVLHHRGPALPSRPYLDMTATMLRERGVTVDIPHPDTWIVSPGSLAARDETIEADLMNAAVFLAAGLVTGGSVTMAWPTHTLQAADAILAAFEAMGARVTRSAGRVSVAGGDGVRGADLDLRDASELTCVLAADAAVADGPTHLRGVAHIRGHETDRLAALASDLTGLGGRVTETADGLVIEPVALHGGIWHTHADHRMAHAGALLGLVVDGVQLDDIGCTTKTMADFPGLWAALVAP